MGHFKERFVVTIDPGNGMKTDRSWTILDFVDLEKCQKPHSVIPIYYTFKNQDSEKNSIYQGQAT